MSPMDEQALRAAVREAMRTGDVYDIAKVQEMLYIRALTLQGAFREKVRRAVSASREQEQTCQK